MWDAITEHECFAFRVREQKRIELSDVYKVVPDNEVIRLHVQICPDCICGCFHNRFFVHIETRVYHCRDACDFLIFGEDVKKTRVDIFSYNLWPSGTI